MVGTQKIGHGAAFCLWEIIFCVQASRAPEFCLCEGEKKGSQDSLHLGRVVQWCRHWFTVPPLSSLFPCFFPLESEGVLSDPYVLGKLPGVTRET